MYRCKFGQSPSTGSEDNTQKRSYTGTQCRQDLHQKQYVPPPFGCGNKIIDARIAGGKRIVMSGPYANIKTPMKCHRLGTSQYYMYILFRRYGASNEDSDAPVQGHDE